MTRTTDAFDERDWLETEVCRTFLAPAGQKHVINVNVGAADVSGMTLTFAIPEDTEVHASIDDPLHDLLCRLAPHIVRASRMASELMAARRIAMAVGSALDAQVLPMGVIDAGAAFHFADTAGRRMLDDEGPSRITASRRLAASGVGDAVLEAGLREALQAGAPTTVRAGTAGAMVS